jgi:hypothetical protein
VQRVLKKNQSLLIENILNKFKGKLDKTKRVLLNTKQDDLSGGVTSIIKFVEPGYNRALFITWDRDPVSKNPYIFRLEITEKYDEGRPTILVDKKFIDEKADKTYPIDKYISMFIEGIIDESESGQTNR